MSVQRIALVGNPNSGKTALFNLLTGSRQKVGNYPGVTVERKSGKLATPSGRNFEVLDLPGAYTLTAASPDEEITRDICLGRFSGEKLLLLGLIVRLSGLLNPPYLFFR